MTFYLTIALMFFCIDFANNFNALATKRFLNYFSLAIFVLVAGTRFETGYDWQAYTSIYNSSPSLKDILLLNSEELSLVDMEPLFLFVNVLLKTVCNNVAILFFAVALFNGITIHKLCSVLKVNSSFVFAVYFCVAYLTGQMTLLRQSIASSFVLIALVSMIHERPSKSYFFGLVSLGFQVSTLVFSPIFFFKKYKPNVILITFCLFTFILGVILIDDIVIILLTLLLKLTSGNIAIKLAEYIDVGQFNSSFGSWVYLVINLIVLRLTYTMGIKQKWQNEFLVYFYSTLLMIFALTLLSHQPIFWNRIQLVVVPLQAILLFKFSLTLGFRQRLFFLIAIYLVSFMILIYSLLKENMSPFIPYQSIIEHIYSNERGDGAYRLESVVQ